MMIFLGALCLVWAGMVLGISFLETPVKFTAPSVSLPIGLDIGRHVFGAFNKVEIAAALVAAALLFFSRAERGVWLTLGVVVVIVGLQSLWLLPLLDARVGMILAGETPPRAAHHLIYIALEVFKLAGLLTAGILCLKAMSQR